MSFDVTMMKNNILMRQSQFGPKVQEVGLLKTASKLMKFYRKVRVLIL